MILALARPDPKKNITTLVKAFGECRPLRELANLVCLHLYGVIFRNGLPIKYAFLLSYFFSCTVSFCLLFIFTITFFFCCRL